MFDMMLVLVIIVLIIMGVVQIKGWVWLRYKALYFKRLIWVQLEGARSVGTNSVTPRKVALFAQMVIADKKVWNFSSLVLR